MLASSSVGSARSNLFDLAASGMNRAFSKANAAGAQIANGDIEPQPFVDLIEAKASLKANAAVMRTADEMLGTLLDEKA
ncbi:MAG TPA: hypothetical protein VFT72_03455 [Opitutaceae bacterium]|nr:hypothetical protein [Opitutaceae bacterium]